MWISVSHWLLYKFASVEWSKSFRVLILAALRCVIPEAGMCSCDQGLKHTGILADFTIEIHRTTLVQTVAIKMGSPNTKLHAVRSLQNL